MLGRLPRLNTMHRRLTAGLLALATVAGMGGLTACDSAPTVEAADISIVASTNVYGSIAKTIAGENATVHSLIDDPAADPHSYEASPADIAALRDADIVIVNGGGYDEFAVKALTGKGPQTVINAYSFLKGDTSTDGSTDADNKLIEEEAEAVGEDETSTAGGWGNAPATPNEHVFYNVDVAKDIAADLTTALCDRDPANQTTYQANKQSFDERISEVKTVMETLADERAHARFLHTEPLATYLTGMAEMVNMTPRGFAEAIEEGADVPALQVAAMRDAITAKKADVLLYNTQNANTTTQEIRDLAEKNGVPVVELTETLPENKDYTTWMVDNATALAIALGVKPLD